MAKILFVLFLISVVISAEDVLKSKEKALSGDKNWPKPVGPAIGDISDNEDSDSEWFPNVEPITKPDFDISHTWDKPSVDLPWPPKKPDNSLPWPMDPGKEKPWVPNIDSNLNKPSKPWEPTIDNDLNKPWPDDNDHKPWNDKPNNGKPWNKPATKEPWDDDDDKTTKKPWGPPDDSDGWTGHKPWNTKPEGQDWNPIKPWQSKPPNVWKPSKPHDEDVFIEEVGGEDYEPLIEEEPEDGEESWQNVNPQKRPQSSTPTHWNPNNKPPQPFYPETKPDQVAKPQQGKPWNKPGRPGNVQIDPWSSADPGDYPVWPDKGPKPVNKPKPKPRPNPVVEEDTDGQFDYSYPTLGHKPDSKPQKSPRRPYFKPGKSWALWHKNHNDSSKEKIDLYKQPLINADNKADQSTTSVTTR